MRLGHCGGRERRWRNALFNALGSQVTPTNGHIYPRVSGGTMFTISCPPPGVGKSHLAFSLATAAAESGRCVYFGTLVGLIESLEQAEAAGQLSRRLRALTRPALLVVDEIGYPPVTRNGGVLFFKLINGRYEQASMVLTFNKGFEEWDTVIGDEVMAAALIDRTLHDCHIVNIRGNSYRMREHQEMWPSMHAPEA